MTEEKAERKTLAECFFATVKITVDDRLFDVEVYVAFLSRLAAFSIGYKSLLSYLVNFFRKLVGYSKCSTS